ncbi:zf-HC2 domain-containing protein [Actinoplanes sp. NPDC051475]|uniref:anti-sigma factor family protein n=1 Tax=Actinoplanes sp. NPDC051475 TaxID=3157225 RepID=UPI00344DC475
MKTNHVDLAGYLTKSLDADQIREVEEHLAGCDECRAEVESLREWTMALEAVPEAMLLDGPPDDADLLLQRTLRQIRNESAGRRHRRTALVGAAAAVVVGLSVASGVVVGHSTAPPKAQPVPTQSVPTTAPGTKTATAVDPVTKARITVAVAPAPGWVRVKAAVSGIPAGERCRLEVVARDGTAILAGSWVVSATGAADGTTLDGSALVPPDQVASVRVVTEGGKQYTSVAV